MIITTISFLPILFLCVILWLVTVEDFKQHRISNRLVLAALVVTVADLMLNFQLASIVQHILFAIVLSLVFLLMYVAGGFGGGDLKLIGVALLSVGVEGAGPFAIALFVATLLLIAGLYSGWLRSPDGTARRMIPFGPAIALGWLAALAYRLQDTINITG